MVRMVGMADEADRAGDIATALRLIKVGDDRPLSIEEINDLLDHTDPTELWHGYATLLSGWLMGCTQPEVGTAVISRLRRFGLFPEETLTTIGKGLAAAIRGERPSTWRREHDPISRVELAGWLYAAWLVADLIDLSQGKGTVARATIDALMELAEKANEGKRHCSFAVPIKTTSRFSSHAPASTSATAALPSSSRDRSPTICRATSGGARSAAIPTA